MKLCFKEASAFLPIVAIIIACLILIITIEEHKNKQVQEQEETTLYMEETQSIYDAEDYAEETEAETTVEVTECETQAFSGYDFVPLDAELQIHIYELCEEYGIAYGLVISLIKTESNFNVNAVGDSGNSIGLMQIQPMWWQDLANSYGLNIYEPFDNVHLGIIILVNALNDNDGDLSKALKQYNSGKPYTESNHYIDRIYENYEWFEGELQSETT